MLRINNVSHLMKTLRFAKKIGKYDSLIDKLRYLNHYACDDERGWDHAITELWPDWGDSPDFSFLIKVKGPDGEYKRRFNGGCLFHGSHDGFGSGSGPTFAVTLEPTDGWSIHT
jgi:hypothetical protein